MTTTAPSPSSVRGTDSRLFSASEAVEAEGWSGEAVGANRIIPSRPGEPNLFGIPTELHPTYRPLPVLVRLVTTLVSIAASAVTTWKTLFWLRPLLTLREGNWKKLIWFAFKACILTIAANCALQDIFLPPSRVSIQTLLKRYYLPSKLSEYKVLPIFESKTPSNNSLALQGNTTSSSAAPSNNLGVHYLEYHNPIFRNNSGSAGLRPQWDAIYMNHGFGASSLSWLPTMPSLVHRLQAAVGLGHDAAGFGFTDRPPHALLPYTSSASAQTGLAVLRQQQQQLPSTILHLGHSMGTITTLRMALLLADKDPSIRQKVILVSPALGLLNNKKSSHFRKKSRMSSRWFSPLWQHPAAYALRRLVGAPHFWRKGLQLLVWGGDSLSDNDVLRYQWPAIGKGWERGLLRFSRAQFLPSELSDQELLSRVLELPSVESVHVIVGVKDKVLSPAMVRKFFKPFPSVRIVEMEGVGHDPFEEDVERFVQVVEGL